MHTEFPRVTPMDTYVPQCGKCKQKKKQKRKKNWGASGSENKKIKTLLMGGYSFNNNTKIINNKSLDDYFPR